MTAFRVASEVMLREAKTAARLGRAAAAEGEKLESLG